MKILVTGGAGFIGSNIVDAYIEEGHQVIVVDNLSTGKEANLNPSAKFYQMDLRSSELEELFSNERPEIVNHHAAQIDVRRSISDPIFDADVNILGSINLLESARKADVRQIIYSSSGGAVYGEPEYLPCDENHPIHPLAPYGASKYLVEHYLYMYKENYGLNYTILRYGNVYGPRQDPLGEAGVVAIFTGKMLAGQQAVINGDGLQQRDFVYVGDCVRANMMATQAGATGVFNIGSGRGTTINEIFDILRETTHYANVPEFAPAIVGETRVIYLDSSKAKEEIGWSPELSLAEGIEKTVSTIKKV